jgi:putative oxidoreductase
MEAAVRRDLPLILIRVIIGLIFLFEGALVFFRPEEMGAAHAVLAGLAIPHLAILMGCLEILGGAAILLNLYAGDAALVLLLFTLFNLAAQLPMLLGRQLGPFPFINVLHTGWLSFLHETRGELCILFCLVAILIDSGLKMGHRRRWYQSE